MRKKRQRGRCGRRIEIGVEIRERGTNEGGKGHLFEISLALEGRQSASEFGCCAWLPWG